MFKIDNKIYKVIFAISVVCILLALYFNFVLLRNGKQDIGTVIHGILNSISLLYAMFYIVDGYKKDSSRYYKSFGILLAITQSYTLAIVSFINAKTSNLIVIGLELITILFLVLSENLGKNNSLILCLVLIALNGVSVLMCSGTNASYSNIFCKFVLSLLYGMLTYAKYLDKESRGAK